ncbi:gamma-glutamylcysteine synthetase [Bosea sp. OAE752]|uniref:hypothetical protein n=1 Tax=Bosea sp. OAE752 TaxID=2663873 RepID=UPI0013AF2C12
MSDEIADDRRVQPIAVDNGAPIISFENFAALGHNQGRYAISLTVGIPVSMSDGSVPTVHRVVAHLYADARALQTLRDAIDKCFVLSADAKGKAQ